MAKFNNIEDFFTHFNNTIDNVVPQIIAETASEDFKENFKLKSFDGVAWEETKKPVKRGSLMVRSGNLMASVRPAIVSARLVRVSAGSSKVPYAQVHNEGSKISRAARSETFVRNRHKKGKLNGAFKKGTSSGQGLSFKAYSYNMPKRQFMGMNEPLKNKIKLRIEGAFNNV